MHDYGPDVASYAFRDFDVPYFIFEIIVDRDDVARNSYSDQEIRAQLDNRMSNSDHVSSYDVLESVETSIAGHPGRLIRYNFVTEGNQSYGVKMVISVGTWLFIFDAYGDDSEYPAVEAMLFAIFSSATFHADDSGSGDSTAEIGGALST